MPKQAPKRGRPTGALPSPLTKTIRAKSDLFEDREYRPVDVLGAASVDFVELIALLLTHRAKLLDAAEALDDLHARVCGCDSPGQIAYCAFEEFAALIPLLVE